MSKKGLREAYKTLEQMIQDEERVDWNTLSIYMGYEAYLADCEREEDVFEEDLFNDSFEEDAPYSSSKEVSTNIPMSFEEWLAEIAQSPYITAFNYDEQEYYNHMQMLSASNEILLRIFEASGSTHIDHVEQIKFAIKTMKANKVIVTPDTIKQLLDLLPENSKLETLLSENTLIYSMANDVGADDLGIMFKKAGKTIDELPEQMLTDKGFMKMYLSSKKSEDPNFTKGTYMDYDSMTFGEIIDKVIKLCQSEIDRKEK